MDVRCESNQSCQYCHASTCQVTDGLAECTYIQVTECLPTNGKGCLSGSLCNLTDQACEGSAEAKTWGEAKAYCESLSYAGHSDWVLPTIDAMRTLVVGCDGLSNTGEQCLIGHSCSYFGGLDYWGPIEQLYTPVGAQKMQTKPLWRRAVTIRAPLVARLQGKDWGAVTPQTIILGSAECVWGNLWTRHFTSKSRPVLQRLCPPELTA